MPDAHTGDTVVVALGGNAIARFGDDGTIAAQYRRATQALGAVADLAATGHRIVLTHGNGPVVGNIVLRGEMAGEVVPPTPLYIAGADSQGGLGLMLQQVLDNELRLRGCDRTVATVITQVVVDPSDPAFTRPTKPIGPYYTARQAAAASAERGWTLAEEAGRGWRRVVASPRPVRIVEVPAVSALLEAGVLPVAGGGGGVPVVESPDGTLSGVDAVIDKDWTGAVLARSLGARTFVVLMEADALYHRFGTPEAERIVHLGAGAAGRLSVTLPAGSIGPKVAAGAWLAERGGTTILCRVEDLADALAGHAGTRISDE